MAIKRLSYQEVCKKPNLDFLDIITSEDLVDKKAGFVNQVKAREAIEFGLSIDKFGYNIYCSGNNSFYKKDYLKDLLTDIAKEQPTPNDLCYVYNFKNKTEPILISLPAGLGIKFKSHMEKTIGKVENEIGLFFKSTLYKKELDKIGNKYGEQMDELHEEYNKILRKLNFQLVESEDGTLIPAPIKKGKILSQEEYDNLPEKEKDQYITNLNQVDQHLIELFDKEEDVVEGQMQAVEKYEKENIEKLLGKVFEEIKLAFSEHTKVITYLDSVIENLLEHSAVFKNNELPVNDIELEDLQEDLFSKKGLEKLKSKKMQVYKVNLIVDNSKVNGCPIVFVNDLLEEEELLSYTQFNISSANVTTDFSQIVAGEILKANGGYLIIDTNSLFYNPGVYDKLKSILKNKKLKIHTNYYNEVLVADSLKPEPIDIDLKVILIGDADTYYILAEHDEDFKDLFRIHAIFKDSLEEITEESVKEYLTVIANYIHNKGLLPFDKSGLEKMLEFSSRFVDDQESYSLDYIKLHSLLNEADALARKDKLEVVSAKQVEESYYWRLKRVNFTDEYREKNLKRNIILLNVSGEEVGVVNGLTVSDYGDFLVGKPARITCNTYKGEDGIISVDRAVELTGPIHDKAIEIIKGCLGKYLAQKKALSLNISLSFEQCYNGIEGDSATCAEMCAIFSDLFNVPVKQHYAITGSMNQKGQVQAIGGVNEKIEGFFNTCKVLGRKDCQGVIIPESNKYDLMLSDEIVQAIREDKFHIYTVNTLEDVLEKMLGLTEEEFKEKVKNFK